MAENDQEHANLVRQLTTPLATHETMRSRIGRFLPSGRLGAALIALVLFGALAALAAPAIQRITGEVSANETADRFCKAVADGDAGAAYALFSRSAQSRLSQDGLAGSIRSSGFTDCLRSSPGGANMMRSAQVDGDTAAVTLAIILQPQGTTDGQAEEGRLMLGRENGEWRIASISSAHVRLP